MERLRFIGLSAAALGGLALGWPDAQAGAGDGPAAGPPQAQGGAASESVATVGGPERAGSKILRWGAFTLTNTHGDSASEVTNFTLTLIAEPGPPDRTMAVVNYDIYAHSQNDRGGGVTFSIDLRDEGGNVILNDAVNGRFMRDHCTHNGAERHKSGPTVVPYNFFGAVKSATVEWRYASHYEGRC